MLISAVILILKLIFMVLSYRLDEVSLRGLKFLSQSTDSLHQGSKVNASTESLTDEGIVTTHTHTQRKQDS